LLLVVGSVLFIAALVHTLLSNPGMLLPFVFLAFGLTVLWAMWTKLPLALRQWIRHRLLDRDKERRP
jgi:hypothetical protein